MTSKTDFRFHHELRVRWSECEFPGVVSRPNCIRYIEIAMTEYYRNLGIHIFDEAYRNNFGATLVKCTMEFKLLAQVDETLDIYVNVARMGSTTISVESEIYRAGTWELLTAAELIYESYDFRRDAIRIVPYDVTQLISR